MRKEFIKTGVLSLVVATIALVAFFELKEFKEEEEVKEIKDRVVKLGTAEVMSVSLKPQGIKLSKNNGNWMLIKPVKDVVQSEEVDAWISKFLAQDGRVLGDGSDKDLVWSEFGFLKDSKEISFKSLKGEDSRVLISDKEAFDGSAYLKTKTQDKTLLISSDNMWKTETLKEPYDFRSKNLLNWDELSKNSKPVSFKVGNPSEKEYYELNFKDEKWTAKRRRKWGIDSSVLENYFDQLRQEQVVAFVKPGTYKGKVELSFNLVLSSGEKIKLEILKDKYTVYAKVSYRPDIVFKLSSKSLKSLFRPLLDLKSKKDFYFFDQEKVKSMLISHGMKSYRVKNEKGVWFLKNKSVLPRGKIFNGAKTFELFKQLKDLGGVRYVKSNTVFYTTKKRITFYNSVNNLYYQLELGQKFPTRKGSRRTDGYLMRSSSSSQLLVVDAKKARDLFKIDYFQKAISNTVDETKGK